MGGERLVFEAAEEIGQAILPGAEKRLLAEASHALPALGRLLRGKAVAPASEAAGLAAPRGLEQEFARAGDMLRSEWAQSAGLKVDRVSGLEHVGLPPLASPRLGPVENASMAGPAEPSAFSRMPRPLTSAEEELRLERLMKVLDDSSLGVPPTELNNQGLGARLWQFGTAGGDVLRERSLAKTTGNWAPEFLRSRQWLQQNAGDLAGMPALGKSLAGGRVQMVFQGESTQFAAGPVSVGLRTDNVATCVAVHCRDGAMQFLGHADGMIHHRALTEALETAGVNLNRAEVTLMPGPVPSPVLETILPTFLDNANAMKRLRIVPFRGPAHGSVIAQDGRLFTP